MRMKARSTASLPDDLVSRMDEVSARIERARAGSSRSFDRMAAEEQRRYEFTMRQCSRWTKAKHRRKMSRLQLALRRKPRSAGDGGGGEQPDVADLRFWNGFLSGCGFLLSLDPRLDLTPRASPSGRSRACRPD